MNKNFFVLLSLAFLYFILSNFFGIYIPCLFHAITGFYCPGCGVTRMLLSMFNFNFYQAFRYNNLLFVLSPFALLLFIEYCYSLIRKRTPFYKKIPDVIWYILIIILIVFGIIRNIFPYFSPTIV